MVSRPAQVVEKKATTMASVSSVESARKRRERNGDGRVILDRRRGADVRRRTLRDGAPLLGGETVNRRLYVGNLTYAVTVDELKQEFLRFGALREVKIINGPDGTSKGFGFVEFEKHEDAAEAMEALNDQELKGRKLRISEAFAKA